MHIRAPDRNLDEPRTLKVTIPVQLHLRLHTLKILEGKNVSETVNDALDRYFEAREDGPASAMARSEGMDVETASTA